MKPSNPRILTVNGGSSSIKFALFETGDSLRRILTGGIDRIGQPEATLRVNGPTSDGQHFTFAEGEGSRCGGGRSDGLG